MFVRIVTAIVYYSPKGQYYIFGVSISSNINEIFLHLNHPELTKTKKETKKKSSIFSTVYYVQKIKSCFLKIFLQTDDYHRIT